jgi:hypothetical protein
MAWRREEARSLASALYGDVSIAIGEGGRAEPLLVESGRIDEELGDRNGMAEAANALGRLHNMQARDEDARAFHILKTFGPVVLVEVPPLRLRKMPQLPLLDPSTLDQKRSFRSRHVNREHSSGDSGGLYQSPVPGPGIQRTQRPHDRLGRF